MRRPPGLLLERIPGRFNLATATDEAHRRRVLDEYLVQLARIHSIPIEEFEAIGYRRPASPEESCFGETRGFEHSYRAAKTRPDPMIEFQLGWCRRNLPRDRAEYSFVVCDSGQFMFDDGGLTGLLDFELAYIGDYAADLAALRTRDLTEPIGDVGAAIRRYGEISGREVDLDVVDYHTIRFALVNPLSVSSMVDESAAGGELRPISRMVRVLWPRWSRGHGTHGGRRARSAFAAETDALQEVGGPRPSGRAARSHPCG